MSEAITRGVRVTVRSQYVPERSAPPQRYFFVYQVTIANESAEPVQLLSREWVITNALGEEHVVRGAGVVGEQPRMAPGEGFQYVSACPLDTAVGTMHGTYTMVTDGGDSFDAQIAPFSLAEPMSVN